MVLVYLILSLISPGDMFLVRYPMPDSLRGMVYTPLDTFYVEDSSTLFSTNLGFVNVDSLKNINYIIKSTYKKILPETEISIERYVKISIIGEVRTPQVIYVNEKEPLSSLIAMAGGPTPSANLKRIKVYTHSKTLNINYYKAIKNKINIKELGLSSGDVIEVKRKFHINFANISSFISAIILLWSFYQTNF